MIDPEKEPLVTFDEALRRAHLSVTPATAYRWARHGVLGVKLESIKIGYRRLTSMEALKRFFSACDGCTDATPRRLIPGSAELDRRAAALGYG